MKLQVSKREQLYLFLLAIFGIVGLLYTFVLAPLMAENTTLKSQRDALDSQKFLIETQVPNMALYETQLENRVNEVGNMLEVFEAPLHSAQFEHRILELITKYDMRVLSTNFSDPEAVTPVAIETLPLDIQYSLGDLVKEYTETTEKDVVAPVSTGIILKTQQSYEVSTNYARFVYFLEAVKNWNTSIIISESSFNVEEGTASFTFDLYFVDQLLLDNINVNVEDITANGSGSGSSNENPHDSAGK